ncbi:FMN-binding protein [Frankia sp. Cj3]|uniref:FMN-binding protein n=1 Tax=Frankia sp. Cj3 TaxID=2880976 RepID=UPI001EF50C84|nr:FMN-binding protein [Frankia sp. Cj3]
MRRIVLAVASTVAGLVLLFSYRTSTSTSTGMAATAVTSSGGSSGDGSSGVSSGSTTLTGSEVNTRWGVVQVQITVNAGRIVNAGTVQVPDHNPRDVEINRVAVPILNSEAVAAQNAKIDVVSGATVTSDGYIRSLQSAIDAAHLS